MRNPALQNCTAIQNPHVGWVAGSVQQEAGGRPQESPGPCRGGAGKDYAILRVLPPLSQPPPWLPPLCPALSALERPSQRCLCLAAREPHWPQTKLALLTRTQRSSVWIIWLQKPRRVPCPTSPPSHIHTYTQTYADTHSHRCKHIYTSHVRTHDHAHTCLSGVCSPALTLGGHGPE